MASPSRLFWDSSAVIAFLQREQSRYPVLAQAVQRAEHHELQIVVSALALCEAARGDEADIEAFFDQPWLVLRQVDRGVAARARTLVRTHGLSGADAAHVACALETPEVEALWTYDTDLLALDGLLGPLRVTEPAWADDQPPLGFEE